MTTLGRIGLLLILAAGPAGAPGAAAATPPPAAGDDVAATVQRVEDYLNGLDTIRARVVQLNPDGSTSTGMLYLDRPDKLRLDYDLPSRVEIVAKGWQLIYHDPTLNQLSYLRIKSTPLAFLLTKDVRLGGEVEVTGVERPPGEVRVTVARRDDPGAGRVTLSFAEDPFELLGWAVTDPQGLTTHVMLRDVEQGVALDSDVFKFLNPRVFGRERR